MLGMSFPNTLPKRDVSLRGLQRQLAALLPDAGVSAGAGDGPSIEAFSAPNDLPRLISAVVIEGDRLKAHVVPPGASVPFAAFLDGTQQSRVFQYAARGVPVIHGTVGGVIRVRTDRRMTTWRHEVTSRLYAPKGLLPLAWNEALAQLGVAVVDTSESGSDSPLVAHPFALRDAAIHRVQADRETSEHRLAHAWCETVAQPLFIDGGISASERLATNSAVVGVVKNHRTLYAEGEGLEAVFGLRAGERTSVFQVTSPKRTTVASWYLRLRDPSGHDPMWGLVRVEVAYSQLDTNSRLANRADDASRQILAEVSPVALPDARWDRMVYGIRDCEEFLRSVM